MSIKIVGVTGHDDEIKYVGREVERTGDRVTVEEPDGTIHEGVPASHVEELHCECPLNGDPCCKCGSPECEADSEDAIRHNSEHAWIG